jgi:hypothetical protein
MSAGLTQLIRSLALMMLIKILWRYNEGRHPPPSTPFLAGMCPVDYPVGARAQPRTVVCRCCGTLATQCKRSRRRRWWRCRLKVDEVRWRGHICAAGASPCIIAEGKTSSARSHSPSDEESKRSDRCRSMLW